MTCLHQHITIDYSIATAKFVTFLRATAATARMQFAYAIARPSVRLPVRPSHGWISQ